MDNIKIGMLIVSLLINVMLYSEVRKQAGKHDAAMTAITTKLDLNGKAAGQPLTGTDPKDKSLSEMVGAAVHEEFNRAMPQSSGGMAPADKAKMESIQERLEKLQARIDEKGNSTQDKEKRLREEATKLKQEVLAACVKR